ncbi:YczE/YyaS/YitT family protein [Prevotella sp.]|uniref:YczE/YyaS/YitT family protein n=1 Tax=Prevotella sp. TaxID=59823 RepID=UPI003DA26901
MKKILARYLIFTVGLYLLSLGIVLIIRSALGTTPISSLNYVVSLNTSLSLGTCTFIQNLFLIAAQFWLIRGNSSRKKIFEILMQLPFSFVFGVFIDFNMYLCNNITPNSYITSIILLLIGCVVQSTAVVLEVKPNVVMMSAEGFVKYSADRYNKEFGKIKRKFDIFLVVLAVLASLVMSKHIQGVREGTVIAALITGTIVTFISQKLLTRRNFNKIRNIAR